MCGISGIIMFEGRPESEAVQKMNLAQHYRGPDGSGIFSSEAICFGHVRLSIIDLAHGAQPFVDEGEQIVLTYNGEVYNYRELKTELARDFQFKTDSDTEVVLKSYQKWGIACLERFRGMFAFALYDKKNQKVFLVRDRLGIKPLYYYQSSKYLVFCSELQALTASGIVPKEIEPSSISSYLKYQYVPTPASIYRNVYKLPPAHYLELDLKAQKNSLHPFWQLPLPKPMNSKDWLGQLNELIDNTISLYCRADVPFGSFLSGGVDSTLVTGAMSKCLSTPLHTFSVGFEEQRHSELEYAREVSRNLKTVSHEKVVSPTIDEALLGTLASHFGEPFADSSAVPTYFVSKSTASHVKMVLSGDGGDELFAGYDSYRLILENQQKGLGYKALCHVLSCVPKWGACLSQIKQRAKQRNLHFEPFYDQFRQIFSDQEVRSLMAERCSIAPARLYQKQWDLDEITHFQLSDLTTYLHDDVLTKVDRMSMAHSLEVRVPLLDHMLVELAFSMPIDLKIRYENNQIMTKKILKQSASRFIGMHFLNRKKQGFGIPLIEWCSGHLRPVIEQSICNPENPLYEWLDYKQTNRLIDAFFKGSSQLAARVWAILMLDIWLRKVHHA